MRGPAEKRALAEAVLAAVNDAMRAALIPVKELSQAKMRLADVLDRRERTELALAMLTDVITACNDSECFDIVAVVSSDSEVFWHARELGAKPLAEPATLRTRSGTTGIERGTHVRTALSRPSGRRERAGHPSGRYPPRTRKRHRRCRRRTRCTRRPASVIAPSVDNGTNALALRPPEAIEMRFGRDSAAAHRDAALAAGIAVTMLDSARLRFDVDAPEDLEALADLKPGAATTGWLEARAYEASRRASGS